MTTARRTRTTEAAAPHFLQRIAEHRPRAAAPAAHGAYLELVDRCLVGRATARSESERLLALAAELGVDRAQAAGLNRRYFEAVVAVAWERGALTRGERAELATVAALLQVPPAVFEAAVTAPPAGRPAGRAVPGEPAAG